MVSSLIRCLSRSTLKTIIRTKYATTKVSRALRNVFTFYDVDFVKC